MSNLSINPSTKESSSLKLGVQTLASITDITPPLTTPGSKTYEGSIKVKAFNKASTVVLEKEVRYSINKVKEAPSIKLTPYLSRYVSGYNREYQQTTFPGGSLDLGHMYGLPYQYVPLDSPDGVYKWISMNELEDSGGKSVYEMFFRIEGGTVDDLSYVPSSGGPSGEFIALTPTDTNSPNIKLSIISNNPTLDPHNFTFDIRISNQALPDGTTFQGIIDPGEVILFNISSNPTEQSPSPQYYQLVWINREPSPDNSYTCDLTLNGIISIYAGFNLDGIDSEGNTPTNTIYRFTSAVGEDVSSEESGSSAIPAVNPTREDHRIYFTVPSKVGLYSGKGLYVKVNTEVHLETTINGVPFTWDGPMYFRVYRWPNKA